jgi:transcriptional regulator with XRE-family HTH domain
MTDLVRVFGENIRHLRDVKCWSQEQLAQRAGLHRSYVGEIERGEVTASILTVEKLANAFDIPMANLLIRENQSAITQ